MTPEALENYVLGRLGPEATEAIEESLFLDPDGADKVASVRAELIDAYLSRRLSAADRSAVEACIQNIAVWRKALSFAKALGETADARPPDAALEKRAPRWPWLAALGGSAALAAALTLFLVPAAGAPVVLDATTMRAQSTIAELARDEHGDPIRFEIRLRDGASSTKLRAVVRAGDAAVWSGAAPRGAFEVPVSALPPGVYEVEVIEPGDDVPLARIPVRVR